jgi:hypothetical protein
MGPLSQVAIGRGDDACVQGQVGLSADSAERPALQHSEKARLQAERNLADLVEEERAAACALEGASVRPVCARERAALVAEELACDQVRRQRRAVHRDQRPDAGRAELMEGLGNELLACP